MKLVGTGTPTSAAQCTPPDHPDNSDTQEMRDYSPFEWVGTEDTSIQATFDNEGDGYFHNLACNDGRMWLYQADAKSFARAYLEHLGYTVKGPAE